MKPKNLKFPYRWESRRPEIHEGVLFIPDYYDKHREWSFPDWKTIFGNTNPVIIEYCTGNGTWITEKAKDRSKNWVAVEWRFDRVRKIWAKAKNLGLENLFIVCGEAQTLAREYLTSNSVDEVFINFPDPWPKEKHAKHRLFQAPFVQELARTVKSAGRVTVVTDDPTYSEQLSHEMLSQPAWTAVFPKPYFVTSWEGYGASFFDSLWREKGREIRYFQFEKQ